MATKAFNTQIQINNGGQSLDPKYVVESVSKLSTFYNSYVGLIFYDKSDGCAKVVTSIDSQGNVSGWDYISISDETLKETIKSVLGL